MRVALDTNRYVDFCRRVESVLRIVQEAEQVFLTFVVLAELRAGFLCGSRAAENERTLALFLQSDRVTILYPDEETSHHYARLFLQLRSRGTPIPSNDLWTSALVIQHGLTLCDRDRHFDHLPQLQRA